VSLNRHCPIPGSLLRSRPSDPRPTLDALIRGDRIEAQLERSESAAMTRVWSLADLRGDVGGVRGRWPSAVWPARHAGVPSRSSRDSAGIPSEVWAPSRRCIGASVDHQQTDSPFSESICIDDGEASRCRRVSGPLRCVRGHPARTLRPTRPWCVELNLSPRDAGLGPRHRSWSRISAS